MAGGHSSRSTVDEPCARRGDYRCQGRGRSLASRSHCPTRPHACMRDRLAVPGSEYAIARAWVAAAQGAVSQAVATLMSAAETARASGQFAAEVMCLQTATQFGDHSGTSRLGELAAIVEGPRAGAAARFGAALAAGDGAAWPRCRRTSSGWAILLRPLMRPHTRRWRIAVKACADRGSDARRGRRRWLNDAAPAPPRLVRPVSGCR